MKYMLLIYIAADGGLPRDMDPDTVRTMNEAWFDYTKALADAGVHVTGDALHLPSTAATVSRPGDGEPVVTDGPFAETAEVLGGYYVLDVPDREAAIEWAKRCPGTRNGGKVEVRPVVVFDETGAPA